MALEDFTASASSSAGSQPSISVTFFVAIKLARSFFAVLVERQTVVVPLKLWQDIRHLRKPFC